MTSESLVRDASSLFVVGFAGPTTDRDIECLIDQGVGGVILFKRNIESPDQVLELNRQLKKRARGPLLASVDQEGGRVARLRGAPFTALPSMRDLARGGPEAASAAGQLLAIEVRAAGFDWDFAPVVDVDTNPANPVIGDRSFSRSAEEVTLLGLALARALEAGGVASCAKHFPGHGDTHQDSHQVLPRLMHPIERLLEVELVPFGRYARANLCSMMTAHVVFEAVDPGVPATMSRKVLTGILRERLGFDGVVVSDDMEMKAIADAYDIPSAIVESLNAGTDMFLVCHQPSRQFASIEAVVRAVEAGRVPRDRFDAAVRRSRSLRSRFAQGGDTGGYPVLNSAAHQALAQRLLGAGAGVDPTEQLA